MLNDRDRIPPSDDLAAMIWDVSKMLGRLPADVDAVLVLETYSTGGDWANVVTVSLRRRDRTIAGFYRMFLSSSTRFCSAIKRVHSEFESFDRGFDDHDNVRVVELLVKVTGRPLGRLPDGVTWSNTVKVPRVSHSNHNEESAMSATFQPNPADEAMTQKQNPMTDDSTTSNPSEVTLVDPSQLTGGFITAHQMRTHGDVISRGMFLLSSISSEESHRCDLKRNYEAIVEFVQAATGKTEPRQVMATAFRDLLCDMIVLAQVYGIDLHEAVNAAAISARDNLGLPMSMCRTEGDG